MPPSPELPAQLDPCDAVLVAVEIGEAVVEDRAADGSCPTEVVLRSVHAAGVGRKTTRVAVQYRPHAGTRSVSVSTVLPSFRYGCAPLPYGQGSLPVFTAVVRTVSPARGQGVLDRERERERIPGPGMKAMLESDVSGLMVSDHPGLPPDEPVDGVVRFGFVERELVASTAEVVGAVFEAVRPGCEDLALDRRGTSRHGRSRR